MTAEIALLNKDAVALAADSAATVRDESEQKIFTSANKIFALSKYRPVGIMIFGNANFMGVPWETIIKSYRKSLGNKSFNTLGEYSQHFIAYLKKEKAYFPEEEQDRIYARSVLGYYLTVIRYEIEKGIEEYVRANGKIPESVVKKILSQVINKHYLRFKKSPAIVNQPNDKIKRIITKHSKLIKEIKSAVFEKLPISNVESRYLTIIAGSIPIKFPNRLTQSDVSGLVIAGFGDKDIFPSIRSFSIEMMTNNILKHIKVMSDQIDFNTEALIIPFAQQEMVYTLMEGVNRDYMDLMEDLLKHVIKDYPQKIVDQLKGVSVAQKKNLKAILTAAGLKTTTKIINQLDKYRELNFSTPITKVVSFLPKDELASMAEALVNLTCLKKRITMEDETVGGPIDVAVISKGDGLIWIRRKHYFNPELNRYYIAKNYK